jgi:hypothetical protein
MSAKRRHVPTAAVSAYVEQGVGAELTVAGEPDARLRIDPGHSRLCVLVRVNNDTSQPDLTSLANVGYELEDISGAMWHRLDVQFDDNLAEVYSVVCAVLDRVQCEGEPFSTAVSAVLSGLCDILAGRGGLRPEKQVGLFGELAVLLALAVPLSPATAVAAWRGPDHEEHDFGLPDFDLEVKTTTSEQRTHWISGASQLVPTAGRPLYLVSLQLTGAGAGPGTTLPELVARARDLAGRPAVEAALTSAGYQDAHADLYPARRRQRTDARFFLIDDDFPAITPTRIANAVPSAGFVVDVRYRLDLDDYADSPSPFLIPDNEAIIL